MESLLVVKRVFHLTSIDITRDQPEIKPIEQSVNQQDTSNMSRFLLVPENGDMSKTKQIQLPKNLIVPGTPKCEEAPTQVANSTVSELIYPQPVTYTELHTVEPVQNVLKGEQLNSDLALYTVNTFIGKHLLKFLRYHQFNVDRDGKLIFRGVKYPLNLVDHFMDLVDGGDRKPKGHEILYKLLNDVGLKFVCADRMNYFK